ncbi:hypothetical protein Tco_1210978 [Tanacetum coccineum]
MWLNRGFALLIFSGTFCHCGVITPSSNLECKFANKRRHQEESIINAIRSWSVSGGSLQLVREALAESSPPMLDVDEEDLDLSEENLKQCRRKICDGHYTAAVRVLSSSSVTPYNAVILDRIKSFPRGTSCGRDGLHGKYPTMLGEYIASAPLTLLVKPGGSIRPIVFGVGLSGGGEAILHVVNCLIEDRGDDVGLSMLLLDFKKAFNLIEILCLHAWYLDDGTIVGDTLVVRKVLELIMEHGPRYGLHLNVDKTKILWPKEDPRSRLKGVFPPNISRPLHGVKLLGRPVSVNLDFSSELVMKRVSKTIRLIDAVAKINDPQCELLLLRDCTGISELYFSMRTCPPRVFESAQRSLDVALRSALESISGALQTKLLRHVAILAFGFNFDDALCVFNTSMEIDLLSNTCIPLFSVLKPWSACSSGFAGDIYGDHVVPCAGISAGKEVDIGLDGGCDKPLRPADMLLYSWDGGLDECMDLTGSLPMTQIGIANFVLGHVMIDAAQCKCVKYMAKCAAIGTLGYVLLFIFLIESVAIAKEVGAQIVSRLSSNLL